MSATTSSSASATSQQSSMYNLQELLDSLFLVLSEKEVSVISKRFALRGEQKQTLEKIGRHFKVTRERIRQIESIALNKLRRTVRTTLLAEINDIAKAVLNENGGLMAEKDLVTEVLRKINSTSEVDGAVLRLAFSIDNEMVSGKKNNIFFPFWRLDSLSIDDISVITKNIEKILRKRSSCMKTNDIVSAIQSLNLFDGRVPSEQLVISCMKISEHLKEIDEGWGLVEWRHVKPKSIADKIMIVLKKIGEPLHYLDIANRIREAGFDHKNCTVQAVHNELIRGEEFILMGRGLYALKDWGYEPGTVADVIERILKEKGPLSKKEIIAEVGKHRTVKVGTISLNLQKMPYFVRVGRAIYDFDASKK